VTTSSATSAIVPVAGDNSDGRWSLSVTDHAHIIGHARVAKQAADS